MGVVLLVFLAVLFVIWFLYGRQRLTEPEDIVWGVTYSALASEELGLDPKEAYDAVVDDLKPNKLRLVAYWNRSEPENDKFDFSELDYQVERADEAGIRYTITVGNRVPRYPECHTPAWVEELSEEEKQQETLEFLKETITRYEDNDYLEAWQIENEAFVGNFGICPPLDESFLAREIALARELSDKKIHTTESGELSFWFQASDYPDVLGTTLYRTVIFGKSDIVVRHIYPPWYYRARSNLVKALNPNLEGVIVAELQAEPWASKPIIEADEAQLQATMNPEQFERNIDFTESVGFPEVYFWGAEWWFYEKEQGNDYYWERTKLLFDD